MGQLLSVLLLVGFVGAYFKWIALAVVAYLAWRWGQRAWVRHCADADAWTAEQKAIAKRADQQHAWTLAGDPRGTYGVVTKGKRTAAPRAWGATG